MTAGGRSGDSNPSSPPTDVTGLLDNSPGPGTFRSLAPLSRAITISMGCTAVIELVSIMSSLLAGNVLHQAALGETVDRGLAATVDQMRSAIGIVEAAFALANVVLFCLLMPRANRNARSFGVDDLEFTPRWSALIFFVPVFNLWKPYGAMKQLWQASETDPRIPPRYVPIPGLLPWWWALFLAKGISGWYVGAMQQMAAKFLNLDELGGVRALANLMWVEAASGLFTIASAVLAAAVVRALTRRQDDRQANRPGRLSGRRQAQDGDSPRSVQGVADE